VRLDLAGGLPPQFWQGTAKCYEYAAYGVAVSDPLRAAALREAGRAAQGHGDGLQALARRPEPEVQTDEHGYKESRLFNSFSCLALCVDDDDDMAVVCRRFRDYAMEDFQTLSFTYHGKLHFTWGVCVLEPKTRGRGQAFALQEIGRMLECVQIAHVFLGTCEAFQRLFLHETVRQAGSYLKGHGAERAAGERVRDVAELNRLRTLALAVVSLTSYAPVAIADEDQAYFRRWEQHAKMESRHRQIQQQGEILYNVQVAETQAQEARLAREDAHRQNLLNQAVLVLTAFTFISVALDSYQFVREQEHWLQFWLERLGMLALLVAALIMTVGAVLRSLSERRRRG
jgi:hypothetical protein